MINYYFERVDKNHAILHEEEVGHTISRIEAKVSIAWMKMRRVQWVRGMSMRIYQEALAEMNKDSALFTTKGTKAHEGKQ